MTAVFALESAAQTQPIRPERSESEYYRHGTTDVIANFDVAILGKGEPGSRTNTKADLTEHAAF